MKDVSKELQESLREQSTEEFRRRGEVIRRELALHPNDIGWRRVRDDYNAVARSRGEQEV